MRTKVVGLAPRWGGGDALGLPIEFSSMDQIHRLFGARGVAGYPTESTQRATFSDHTQMTFWTSEVLIRERQRQRKSTSNDWGSVVKCALFG